MGFSAGHGMGAHYTICGLPQFYNHTHQLLKKALVWHGIIMAINMVLQIM
jgi:hypothetical protein